MEVKVLKDILSANDQIAEKNRTLMDNNGAIAVNIMASPGAGKTSVIMQTINRLKDKVRIGVIEGDISSSVDAETISKEGIPAIQINTGGGCHLDANMVSNALPGLPLGEIDLIFIENVGNLICPAGYDLGDRKRVIICSIPEGDDKPIKYPVIFHNVDIVLLNKFDLLPYVKFDVYAFYKAVRNIKQNLKIIQLSCVTGQGVDEWISWLKTQRG